MNKRLLWKASVAALFFFAGAYAQNARVPWSSFAAGYVEQTWGNTVVQSIVGQNIVGPSTRWNTQITSGFLGDTAFGSLPVSVERADQLPARFALAQNYPNPFNPATTIHFEIPKQSRVVLKVYNVLGQEVLKVVDEEKVVGSYDVRIDASALSSGVYFYRLTTKDFAQTRKLVLLK